MLFVDSADHVAIGEIKALGIARGITTNPLFLPRTPELDQSFTLRDILRVASGHPGPAWPVSVQLTAADREGMFWEAVRLKETFPDDHLVFKVPFSMEGLRVISELSMNNIQVNATSLMSAQQAYLAAQAGANYVSLFYGRIADSGNDPRAVLADTRRLIVQEGFNTEIIAGSLRQVQDVMGALLAGAHIATVKPEILKKMMAHPLTEQVNEEFRQAVLKNNALYDKR